MNLRSAPPQSRAGCAGLVRGSACLVVYALVASAALLPLLWATVPPLVDYPNHLARTWILAHTAEVPELAGNYAVHWRILPDLAIDLVVTLLSRIMPVEEAGRLFVALTMLALLGGTIALHRVLHERLEVWPICGALFIYNAALFWGFVNCLFATGMYLFAFSGWIASREWPSGRRILLFSAVASLLLVLHLFAFGLYALSVGSYELGTRTTGRLSRKELLSLLEICLQFVPGALLWYMSLSHGGTTLTSYGDLIAKFYAIISPFTFSYEPPAFDRAILFVVSLLLAVAVLTRSLMLVPQMRLPLAAMIIVAALMPNRLSGSWSADIRLPVALPFVVIASTRLEVSRNKLLPLAGAALALFGLRVWTVSQAWSDFDRMFGEFRAASAAIAPGARLLIVESPIPEQRRKLPGLPIGFAKLQAVSFIHMAGLAVIDRSVFVPYLFTGWTTIASAERNAAVSQAQAVPMTPEELAASTDPELAKTLNTGPNFLGERPYWRDWPETFDFVLWIDFGEARRLDIEQLAPLARGSFFNIYRIVRPPAT
jgi:hypothetical protein